MHGPAGGTLHLFYTACAVVVHEPAGGTLCLFYTACAVVVHGTFVALFPAGIIVIRPSPLFVPCGVVGMRLGVFKALLHSLLLRVSVVLMDPLVCNA